MKNMILVAAIALMILFSGCTGQQGQTQTEDKTQTTVKDQAKGPTTTVQASSGGGKLNELLELFKTRPKQYTITYDVTTRGDETGDIKSQVTHYIASEEKMRMDMSSTYGGELIETRIFILGKDMITCSKQEGQWSCMKFTSQEDTTKDPDEAMAEMEENIQSSSVTRIGDRVIAGMSAKCYSLKMTLKDQGITAEEQARLKEMSLDSWEATYCISADGTPLYIESKGGDMLSIMEAKSYRPSVSESDFVPPAQPTDMAALMKGMASPSEEGGDGTDMTMPAGYEDLLKQAEQGD